jgi:DNA-binding response OmpR family regulator
MELTGKKILVVEEDAALSTALHDTLVGAGFAVYRASNGLDGLLVASQERPDLILLDIMMPVMNGWEMLEKLRGKDDWGKCVPVIILTNLSAGEDAQIRRIAELGPSFFMEKASWTMDGIVGKVQEVLSEERPLCP